MVHTAKAWMEPKPTWPGELLMVGCQARGSNRHTVRLKFRKMFKM